MKHGYSRELETAIKAVREAAKLCRSVQSSLTPESMEKMDRSPVTIADFGSQALICRRLLEAFPNDPVVAEEGSASLREKESIHLAERMMSEVRRVYGEVGLGTVCDWIDHGGSRDYSERFWTLDPIDGTKGFLRGGQYAVALALIVNGRVEVGVLGCPNLGAFDSLFSGSGSIFSAVRGAGTRMMPIDDERSTAIGVSTVVDPAEARFCESHESGHSDRSWSAAVARRLKITREPVRIDSQAKYAVVASGKADIYLRLPTTPGYREKIWDHAAGKLVVEEAGGAVSDASGRELDFTHGYLLVENRGVIVTGGVPHEKVIEAVQEAMEGNK